MEATMRIGNCLVLIVTAILVAASGCDMGTYQKRLDEGKSTAPANEPPTDAG